MLQCYLGQSPEFCQPKFFTGKELWHYPALAVTKLTHISILLGHCIFIIVILKEVFSKPHRLQMYKLYVQACDERCHVPFECQIPWLVSFSFAYGVWCLGWNIRGGSKFLSLLATRANTHGSSTECTRRHWWAFILFSSALQPCIAIFSYPLFLPSFMEALL